MGAPPTAAVTFDFGQTLAELDTRMLAARAAERGVRVAPAALDGAVVAAWRAYDRSVGSAADRAWKAFMVALLDGAGVAPDDARALADWLWTEQPARNLWRRPIAGMIDVARGLARAGVPVGIVSNSEGRLAELAAEIGWGDVFQVIADSGRLGIDKPDPAIYRWAAERLGVPPARIVHVGDSFTADVQGALGAGERAVWFVPDPARGGADPQADPARLRVARDAAELRAALAAWGLPGLG